MPSIPLTPTRLVGGTSRAQTQQTRNDETSVDARENTNMRIPGRRASVRSAMGGMQRFRQSWISILVLKGGVGLAQVTTLLTLLILASIFPSPIHSDWKQNRPSAECPRPKLFQAWMGVQIFRLTLCWTVSMWICLRRRRVERRNERFSHQTNTSMALQRSTTRVIENPPASSPSTSTISMTVADHSSPISDRESNPRSPESLHTPFASSGDISIAERRSSSASPSPSPKREKRRRGDFTIVEMRPENGPEIHQPDPAQERLEVTVERVQGGRNSLQAARDMVAQHQESGLELPVDSRLPVGLDKWAPKITNFLALLSSLLFILGNVLLFHPLPTGPSCYTASPMLWWGVMSVTGVGWFFIAQVLVMVLVVGIGGSVVLALLRRIGLIATPPEPEPYRPARPRPLTIEDLDRIKLVCYLPASPDVFGPEEANNVQEVGLPYPALRIDEERAACAICQENYVVPESGDDGSAEALRLLGCGHVYHAKCIDEWLLRGAGDCPFCNRSVMEMLGQSEGKEPVGVTQSEARRGRLWTRARPGR
ncbi:hypothetical protein IAR55_003924 [Kwoniella newhampshirensis]|uniref:RING-type domain-containing protein n=1 Tax=Kwoniella newhampshirensis TaxID=1651941 RepID=A0AAW0YYI1_9TREE